MIKKFFQIIFRWTTEKTEVNYLYFLLVLASITGLICLYFPFLNTPLLGIPLFFFLYALGQALLEVSIFVLTAHLIKRYAPKWIHSILTSIIFALLVVHFTDFILLRLMDTSIMYFFKFLIGHNIDHMISVFHAINLNRSMMILIVAAFFAIPMIGISFDRATHYFIKKKPFKLSFLQIFLSVGFLGLTLLTIEFFALPHLSRLAHMKYQKTLPFGKTFLTPLQRCISLSSPISPPPNEEDLLRNTPPLSLSNKPNLYLFIIETLRKDFITEITAPHLTAFANENIQFTSSFSNANGTPHSWFAILHSIFPHHWKTVHDNWKKGSIPLRLLQNAGYKICVYSSADLHYFDMDQMLFGQRRELVDHIEEYGINLPLEAWERDALALRSFQRDITEKEGKEGNLYIFFLDATHSEYSFPPDFPLKFLPIPKQIDYLTLTQKDLEPIKNRYRNSISYIDSLMNTFFSTLRKENLYEDAIIAITGDHGEEFFEEGALFHGTHLNHFQTYVPLFFKFPKDCPPIEGQIATHLDILPSFFHYLTKTTKFAPLFHGESIFAKRKWPYRMAIQQNGADHPCEFIIEREGAQLHARFFDPRNIYKHNHLEILSIQTTEPFLENDLDVLIKNYFPGVFDPLISKVTPWQIID